MFIICIINILQFAQKLIIIIGKTEIPDEDLMAEMYEISVSILKEAGFDRYEVSNFAKYDAAESRHNKTYWNGLQYIGIGPGAHSRVVSLENLTLNKVHDSTFSSKSFIREARINVPDPANWLTEINKKGNGIKKITKQNRQDVLCEFISTAMRTKTGIESHMWNIFCPSLTLPEAFEGKIDSFQDSGLLILTEKNLTATSRGLNILDYLLPYLLNIVCDNKLIYD